MTTEHEKPAAETREGGPVPREGGAEPRGPAHEDNGVAHHLIHAFEVAAMRWADDPTDAKEDEVYRRRAALKSWIDGVRKQRDDALAALMASGDRAPSIPGTVMCSECQTRADHRCLIDPSPTPVRCIHFRPSEAKL